MSEIAPAAAGNQEFLSKQGKRSAALRLLRQALQLLDEGNAPAELGAQLDQVINRLERSIHQSVQRG